MKKNNLKTILLVEDEFIIAEAQAKTIRSFGYNVLVVNSGEQAVELVMNDESIDLILMDINLGRGIDGRVAAERILAFRLLPIVFLTSHTEEEYVNKVKEITRYGYVIKNSGNFVLKSSIEMAFELYDSQIKAENYLEIVAEIIISLDNKGNITLLNDSGYRLLGYDKGQLLGKNWFDSCIPQQNRQEIKQVFKKLMHGDLTQEVKHHENEIITKDNKIKIINWFNTLLHDVEGNITGLLSSGEDVTEKKNIQKNLEGMVRANTRILESISDGFFVLNQDMIVEYYNAAAEKILGKSREEVIGQKLFDVFEEGRGSIFEEKYTYALREQEKCSFETAFNIPPYENWYQVNVYPYNNKISVFFQIITEQKKAKEKINEQYELFKTITETSPVGITLIDNKGLVTFANKMAEKLLGLEKSKIENMKYNAPEWKIIGVNGEKFPDEELPVPSVMKHKKAVYNIEHGIKLKDDSIVLLSINAAPIFDKNGEIKNIIAVLTDITERKKAENEIEQLLLEKNILLKEVHHRIKNNMITIKAFLELESMSVSDVKTLNLLNNIEGKIQSMLVLYDKLYLSENFREISINQYLDSLINDIHSTFTAGDRIKIIKHIDDFFIQAKIIFPLGIIVNELISNSVKYAFNDKDKGIITVSVSLKGNRVSLIIQDNGKGLPETFDIDSSEGFGLKLVKLLADQIDGKFTCENKNGAKFCLEFDK